jgi:polysaccharide deacetylase family protein (PEP-CTERM system associated)
MHPSALWERLMSSPFFLLSIDLEDNRTQVANGERFPERVPQMCRKFLDFFAKHHLQVTFFTVGSLARRYPELIRTIVAAGHEIAAHSDMHEPLDRLSPQAFREDIHRNIEALLAAGAPKVEGFRAPIYSLTKQTAWAYAILREAGIRYSSSVMPAANPLYAWPEFGKKSRQVEGIWELPLTVGSRWCPWAFPSGVYLRVLPRSMVEREFKRHLKQGVDIVSFLHPYDIDHEQERFMQAGINNNRFFNYLLYRNRQQVFPRLERLLQQGFRVATYQDYLGQVLESSCTPIPRLS